jgi:transcriptional regulator with XRE-family HTH domain
MYNLYERIENICRENKTNITAMCRGAGISRASLTELKMGRNKTLSYETLNKIAEYFNVTVDFITGNEQKEKPLVNNDEELTEYLEELKTRPEMKMLFNLAKGATKDDVEKAVKIVEAFLKKD